MLEFIWPWMVWCLPLPFLVNWLIPATTRQESALHVPFFAEASHLESHLISAQGRSIIRRFFMIIAWVALVIAAARPQWVGDPIALPVTGRDLMLAVDISGSMEARDMRHKSRSVSRLTAVKSVVSDFVERRTGDRMGLILFGTNAYLQTPLSFDREALKSQLASTPIGIAGEKTAIGDAIGLTVKRLRERPETSRVLILLTDGRSNAGALDPIQATELAAKEKIKIYTVGVGSTGSMFSSGADIDEPAMQRIAAATGGRYYRARSTRELALIYQKLDELEPIEQDMEIFRPVKSLFFWPLALAFGISILMALFNSLVADWLLSLPGLFQASGRGNEAPPSTLQHGESV